MNRPYLMISLLIELVSLVGGFSSSENPVGKIVVKAN